MGQQEVYTHLKNNPQEWFTSVELSRKIEGSGLGSTNRTLTNMREHNGVEAKKILLEPLCRRIWHYRFLPPQGD